MKMSVKLSFVSHPNLNQHFGPLSQFNVNFSCLKGKMYAESCFARSLTLKQRFVQHAKTKIIPRSANFHPSIWGDSFITYVPGDMEYDACHEQVEELKEEVKVTLIADANEPSKKMSLIDSLQRLGVAYHFEREIEEGLEQIHETPFGFDENDLCTVALRFRLLRHQGYNVTCDVFNKFKDNDGNFKENLINDVSGMLCLYEATHLRVHEEDILDEALKFTTIGLESIVTNLKPPLASQVMHALKRPLHKSMPRLEARHYISVYQEDKAKNESLLKLAKLDFNLLQFIYKKELSELSSWWKELSFKSKLPYARDRLVECYFFALGVYFEPHYASARVISTKVSVLISTIDDTYDAYGTLKELQLFTNAIERFDYSAIDGLPKDMKVLYSTLMDVFNEIEEKLRIEGRQYRINYAKEAMKTLVRAYLTEVKWFNSGYIPTFEEYMQNASISSAFSICNINSLLGMGDMVTMEVFDWAMNEPKLVKASNVIARLMNDMTSHKFEQERGHVCSSVECYMKQYNVSEEEVHDEFNRRLEDAWKDVNRECMKPTAVPMSVLLRAVNLTRMLDVIYKYKDCYTRSNDVMKELVSSVIIKPIPL